MYKANLKYGLAALAGLGITANVNAADLSCSDITFTPAAYVAYEFVDQACLEMVDRNGKTYARLAAQVVAQTAGGTHLRFNHADGSVGPSHPSSAAKTFGATIDGKTVMVKDLAVRQDVNIYVSDAFWTPPAPPAPVAVAAAPPPPPAPEPEPEPEPVVLPTTAGLLPWLALFGSLFLILGGALRVARKQ